jgi:phosphomevalonate kinase
MKDVQTKAPGKLYIAGEYAVVEPGYSAIITTVDLFINLNLSKAEADNGTVYSAGFTAEPVKWQRVDQKVTLEHSEDSLKYLLSAIHTTEEYLRENGIQLVDYNIQIDSELDNPSGRKLGLGSSGAVTVSVVQALLEFYEVNFTHLLIYKLSVLAQLSLGVNSSFGDLAAITYTGWIQYTSFDRAYVKQYRRENSITDTVEAYWPSLVIKRINVSKKIQLLIGWTGSPASSDNLVGAVQDKKQQTQKQYEYFLEESKASVSLLIPALENNESNKIKRAIRRNRKALLQMGEETNVLIETPLLTELIETAERYGGAAKTSGAGGGDSGISFLFQKNHANNVIKEWSEKGITHLPLNIYKK